MLAQADRWRIDYNGVTLWIAGANGDGCPELPKRITPPTAHSGRQPCHLRNVPLGNLTDQRGPAVQDGQDDVLLRCRQAGCHPRDAEVAITLQRVGILGRPED